MTRIITLLTALLVPAALLAPAALADEHAEEPDQQRLFVTVTGSSAQDRAMPLVLANQALDQGAEVRVLLCGDGGMLALADYEAETLQPRGLTPKDLLGRLIQHGATVEVCAIFLPNTEFSSEDLSEGIGTAAPGDVAAWMMGPDTRLFTM